MSYAVVASTLTIVIEARLLSTKTSEELWTYTGGVKVNLSGQNSGGGLVGLIVSAVATAVNTAMADYVKHAHTANRRIVYTIPAGPYNEMYMKDQGIKLLDQTPNK